MGCSMELSFIIKTTQYNKNGMVNKPKYNNISPKFQNLLKLSFCKN